MPDIRYAQFCPLTRAVEILGERWTILIARELFLGPKRFSDLKSALKGVSPSVLADRLVRLEERGIVRRRELPPPAASMVYELDEAGRAMKPLLVELTRWGVRFLGPPGPSEHIRPEWLLLGLQVFACAGATEDIGARLHVRSEDEELDLYVRGGASGTVVSRDPLPFDVTLSGPPMPMLGFASGQAPTGDDGLPAGLAVDGDAGVARRIPGLFDFQPASETPSASTSPSPLRPPAQARSAPPSPEPAAKSGRRKEAARP